MRSKIFMNTPKPTKALRLFHAVLALDFAYSLFNFCAYFSSRADNLSAAVYSLLHFVPLVALILLCANHHRIEEKPRLSLIKKCLIAYLAFDALLGLVTFRFNLPRFIGFLFYAKGWWFYIVYMIRYVQFDLAVNLALVVLYWVAFGFLLVEISSLIDRSQDSNDSEKTDGSALALPNADVSQKISPSFKIAVANMIVLVLQTVLNYYIYLYWEKISDGTTGMQAIGLAFLFIMLLAFKFMLSLPVLILSIIGIIQSNRKQNKSERYNRKALFINIICLVICEVEVFLWW